MKKRIIILCLLISFSIFSQEMILIEGGEFYMGIDREFDGPPHFVRLDSYWISKYEISMNHFMEFYIDNNELFPWNYFLDISTVYDLEVENRILPMYKIQWIEAVRFCNWLSERENLQKVYRIDGDTVTWAEESNGYRLPTEAEWEYAARGGKQTRNYFFSGSNDPNLVSWYGENSNSFVQPIGKKRPNELGLFDMSGNVSEWCWDKFHYQYYENSIIENPRGSSTSLPIPNSSLSGKEVRCVRGSSILSFGDDDVYFRSYAVPSNRDYIGVRVVRSDFTDSK